MTEERRENNMTSEETQKIEELLALFDITPDQITIEETDELVTITVNIDEQVAGRLIGRFAQTRLPPTHHLAHDQQRRDSPPCLT